MPDLIPVDEKTAALIHQMLPEEFQNVLNKALICQAFLVSRDKTGAVRFYVNRTGLLIFMEKKFRGKARYSIRVETLKEEEEQRLRHGLRLENEPFVVLKGIVEVVYEDGTREVFEDIGTASPRDCHHGRLVEMASTRATNRAMRLATSLGFTSVEELPEETRQKDEEKASEPRESQEKSTEDKITEKQLRMLHVLINELAKATESPRDEIVKEIKERYKVQHSTELTKQQASQLIAELQTLIAETEGENNG